MSFHHFMAPTLAVVTRDSFEMLMVSWMGGIFSGWDGDKDLPFA